MVNDCTFVGRLGKTPEVRFTQTGTAVANFSIACSETWNDKEGNKQERTEWVNIVVWGRQAESCGQYLDKGSLVYIKGRLQTRSYDDKSGNKRYVTEVVAERVKFLSKSSGGSSEAPDVGAGAPAMDDDIPF